MNDVSEPVICEFQAIVKLALGSESLRLLFTDRRIIVAHLGKRGAGATIMAPFLGGLSGAFEDLLRRRKPVGRRKDNPSPAEVLASHRDNFPILYEDIVHVDVEEVPRLVILTILCKDEKFEFFTKSGFENVVGVLSDRLGAKLSARRL